MKKLAILTSVLALTACGGGNGGISPVTTPEEDVVMIDGVAVRVADSNSGLSMIDMNYVRQKKYEKAVATITEIENDDAVVNNTRAASTRATSTLTPKSTNNFDGIDEAYSKMNDILVNKQTSGKTDRNILLSLALTGMDKEDIYNLLDFESGDSLSEKIQSFLTQLSAVNQTDAITKLKNKANYVYKDFGTEFDIDLENAQFESTTDIRSFTFVLNDEGKVSAIKTETEETFNSTSNGVFKTDQTGNRYSFEIPMGGNYKISGGLDFATDTDEVTIKNKLQAQAKLLVNNDQGAVTQIEDWFEGNVRFINYNVTCPANANCVKISPNNYTQFYTVETKGKELGLKYSDFGLFVDKAVMHPEHVDVDGDDVTVIDEEITYQEYGAFAGGYDDKIANTPTESATFTGSAFAGVTTKSNDWESTDEYTEPELNFYNGTATLEVTPSKQTLTADFSQAGWYTVVVDDMGVEPENIDIQLTGNVTDNTFAKKSNNGFVENMNLTYYGPDEDSPTEAVGYVQYLDRDPNADSESDWTYKADISFGTKKQ